MELFLFKKTTRKILSVKKHQTLSVNIKKERREEGEKEREREGEKEKCKSKHVWRRGGRKILLQIMVQLKTSAILF